MSALVSVFAKPPLPGEVKTRLAAGLGARRSASLAGAFLLDTWSSLTASHPWARPVLAVNGQLDHLVDLRPPPEIWPQGEGDLGQRMERVLGAGLTRAPMALILGSDSPGRPPRLLDQAHDLLAHGADAVLGPADDGGFYLIGLRRCPRGLLADLPWSMEETFEKTRRRLEDRGLRVALTDPWFDVDHLEDLARLQELLKHGEIVAPATVELLASFDLVEPC